MRKMEPKTKPGVSWGLEVMYSMEHFFLNKWGYCYIKTVNIYRGPDT